MVCAVHWEPSAWVFSQTVQAQQAKGLLVGGGFHQLGVQFIGFLATAAWVVVTMIVIFQAIKHTVGLRVSADEEIAGLDIREHGLTSSYADFVTQDSMGTVPSVMGTAKKYTPASEGSSATQAPAEVPGEFPKKAPQYTNSQKWSLSQDAASWKTLCTP